MKQFQIISFFLFLIIPILASGSPVDPGWYFAGGVGASKPSKGYIKSKKKSNQTNIADIAYRMSPVFDVKVGYRANRFVRLDLNGQYRLIRMTGDIYQGVKAKNAGIMLNLYLDANNYSIVTPYLTAGVGVTTMNIADKRKTPVFSKSNMTQRAVNIGGGVQVQFDETFGVDLIYKWTDLGTLKLQPLATQPIPSPLTSTTVQKRSLSVHEAYVNLVFFL